MSIHCVKKTGGLSNIPVPDNFVNPERSSEGKLFSPALAWNLQVFFISATNYTNGTNCIHQIGE